MAAQRPRNHISAAVREACGVDLTLGNRVKALQNGPTCFPAMITGIAQARQSITFENYRIRSDETGWMFAEALAARARAGIPVKLIYDAVGSAASSNDLWDYLRGAGVETRAFHPLSSGPKQVRDHRKLIVVDGCMAFVGGHCMGNEWSDHNPVGRCWRDTNCRVEGPAVAHLQRVFFESWQETGGDEVDERDPRYYPDLAPVGRCEVMVLGSSTERTITRAYHAAIAHAREQVLITNAYFVPDEALRATLMQAAARGVVVRIIVPSESDVVGIVPAARQQYDQLLEAGIAIYEYQPTVLHAKTAIVDSCWATVGSCNLDHWSLDVNYEANIGVSGPSLIRRLEQTFAEDLAASRCIDLAEWRERPRLEKLKDQVAGLVGGML